MQNWNAADTDCVAMIALHARRSAPAIRTWAARQPDKPLILVLTGTDLYRDIQNDESAVQSLQFATHLVVLQQDGLGALPVDLLPKTRVIYQSATRLKSAIKPCQSFEVLTVGHLRDEKDPLTFIKAAGLWSPIHVSFTHIGDGTDALLAGAAREAAVAHPKYRWLGGLPEAQTRRHIKRAHVLVNTSVMEGGAHVVAEAVQSGTAVLASHISGNVGMLGADYAGYFEVGNSAGLAAMVQRCAEEPAFLAQLQYQCDQRACLFEPALEKRLVLNLISFALKEST